MRDLLGLILVLIILVVIFFLVDNVIQERKKQEEERKKLTRRKRQLAILVIKKNHFKECRDKMYMAAVPIGYITVLGIFCALTYGTGTYFGPVKSIPEFVEWMAPVEFILGVVFLFKYKKFIEIIQILNGLDAKMRAWVYGKREDIGEQIKCHMAEINTITRRIQELDIALAA